MDMSQLSESDLRQIAKGDMRMVSEDGLKAIIRMAGNPKTEATDVYKDVAQEQGGVKNFMAGMGGAMKGMYIGGKQMIGMSDAGEAEDHKRAMKGLESTKSGIVGELAGNILPTIPLMGFAALNTLRGAAGVGGAMGALNPTTADESRLANVALGAAGGAGGQWVGNKIGGLLAGRANMPNAAGNASSSASAGGGSSSASATASAVPTATGTGGGFGFGTVGPDPSAGLNAAQIAIRNKGANIGFRLTPGQASGSKALQQLEAKLESQPMTSGPFNEIKNNNQIVLNRTWAKAIGEDGPTVDATVLEQARDRIGGIYRMVADRTPRQIDPDAFLNRLAGVEGEFEGLANISAHPLVNKFMNYAGKGQATGEQLQDIASKLGKAANQQMTSPSGDRQLGMALFQVKDHADDLLESGLKGDTLAAFQRARNEYRHLMLLTQRVGVINPSNGNVQGVSLANLLQTKDKNGFLFGQNDTAAYNAARFAQAFRPIVGDSGTATRSPLPNPVNFMLSMPVNLATKAYTSQPVVRAAANASAVAENGLVQNELARWLGPRMGRAGIPLGGLLGQAQQE